MASESRPAPASLKQQLFEATTRFEFFQAVRLLRKLSSGRVGVGRDRDPGREVVRFRSDLSYSFPVGDIRSLEEAEGDAPHEMTVSFMGVATPSSFGSLPIPYVEEIRRLERDKDFALRDFLDLFNHRLVSLFYRAWERSRPAVLHDLGEQSAFESALLAAIGLSGSRIPLRLPFDRRELLSRAGLLAMQPAPASAIESLVESVFGIPTRVEQFVPGWCGIEQEDLTRLGRANATLGESVNLGSEVRLYQSKFRIRLGPMDLGLYESLLPGGDGFSRLSSVVQLAAGVELDFDFRLVLKAEEVPALCLGGDEGRDESRVGEPICRLGFSTWLKSEDFDHDVDDAVIAPSLAFERAGASTEMRS